MRLVPVSAGESMILRFRNRKKSIIASAKGKYEEVLGQYNEGLINKKKKTEKNIEIWHGAKNEIEK